LAAAFARLEAELKVEGRPRLPSETVAVLAGRLVPPRVDQLEDATHADLAQALQVLELALYGPRSPSRPDCLRAAAAIDRRAGFPRPSRRR
jgi:hypothetical protein